MPGGLTPHALGWLVAAVVAAVAMLAGCDPQRIERLEEGVATEADVRREFGEPDAVHPEPDGSRTFEYTRQPEGWTNYFITLGPDGKMSALRQVLKPADFEKVKPGLERAEVRRLLGRPARVQTFAVKQEEVWVWRWRDAAEQMLFTVTFDTGGRVLRSGTEPDLRDAGG